MADQLRRFIRRHPWLHSAVRRARRVIRPATPPRAARLELALPLSPGGTGPGPATIVMTPSGTHSLLRRLLRQGIGGYEPETAPCLLDALRQAPDGAALDIGANVGLYSILASCRSGRTVYGFEPTPDLAGLMTHIAEANDLRFHTEQLALGAANGTATLYLSNQTDMSNSLA